MNNEKMPVGATSAVRLADSMNATLGANKSRGAGERGESREPTFTVQVNGAPQTTSAQTLAQWVDAQGVAPNAVATAVNGQFVPRTLRTQTPLCEGDTVVTFQPIEGG